MKIKVGMMPGRLVEVEVTGGISARELFEKANVELANHEIRLDGEKIELDTIIEEGRLLVAMKMIKGNSDKIKVGMMPGRLQEITYHKGMKASELFGMAGVELLNHEIRLDGEKIDLDTRIEGGRLLVAMKMIKGNAGVFKSDLTEDEIELILGTRLPKEINPEDIRDCKVEDLIEIGVDDALYIIDKYMFSSVYEFKQEEEVILNNNENVINILKEEYEEAQILFDISVRRTEEYRVRMDILNELIQKIEK